MKQPKLNFAVFAASLCALLVLAASPVLAHDGNSSPGSNDDSVTSAQEDEAEGENETEAESEVEVHHRADMFRQKGRHELELKRTAETRQVKSKEQRAKTCENIQKAVNRKLVAFNNHADKYLTRLDNFFTKVQAYQTENNLPLANYDELVAAAVQKQSDATVAVDALKSLGTTIDCASSDPAGMLSSVKSGAADARDALNDYRKAIKDVVLALIQANKTEVTTEEN